MSVTSALTLRYANAEAERILGADDGLAQRGRRLRVADTEIRSRLRATVGRLATRLGDADPSCFFVPRPSGAPSYTLVVAPAGAAVPAGGRIAAATLFLTDPVGPSALPRPKLLAEALGLTASEAEVARLAAMGRGMGFVAERLGITLNTARTHLKAVYAKTGVNHQVALARTIADRFPPVRGLNASDHGEPRK
jgi:DNA-binding CsgD family transcriptional regulator